MLAEKKQASYPCLHAEAEWTLPCPVYNHLWRRSDLYGFARNLAPAIKRCQPTGECITTRLPASVRLEHAAQWCRYFFSSTFDGTLRSFGVTALFGTNRPGSSNCTLAFKPGRQWVVAQFIYVFQLEDHSPTIRKTISVILSSQIS